FLPEPHTGEIPAILICPGGGYSKVVMEKEGYKVARWFNEQGIAAFVLKYRLKPDEALRDAQRAVSFLRNYADKYNIDSDRIGVIGFSAGAHLAGNLAFHYNQRMNIDEIDNVSSRPDFWVGVYGSYSNILEENGNTVVKELVPPAFLVHAGNDTKVPVMESVRMYAFLREHDIPAELHIYEQGEHGFALEVNRGPAVTSTVNDWSARLLDWMIIRGYR
ncbi:MAG: alpha/beta hydrolase, partial [Bacteroidales bacterium]